MLYAASQQALALDHDRLPQTIDASGSGVLCPAQRIPQPRDGEAPFLVFLLTLDRLDYGVGQVPNLPIDVVSEDAEAHPDLVGRRARTARQGNGLFQIAYQADEHIIESVNGIAGGPKYGITKQTDGTLSHRAILP